MSAIIIVIIVLIFIASLVSVAIELSSAVSARAYIFFVIIKKVQSLKGRGSVRAPFFRRCRVARVACVFYVFLRSLRIAVRCT